MSLFVIQNSKGGIIINSTFEKIGKSGDIVIDGFQYDALLRVQSHFHADHTVDFLKSKNDHDILMSKATREILGTNENSQDIFLRPGIIGIDPNTNFTKNCYRINLVHNDHVLGSCQVSVQNKDYSIGYSGDFHNPEDHISVNHLIIDGSVAGLYRQRKFSREDAIGDLINIINDKINFKPIIIKAHSGLLEKIYFWISDICKNIPRIGDHRFCDLLKIHSDFGYGSLNQTFEKNSDDGLRILRSKKPYIRFIRQGEDVFNYEDKILINCTRFRDNDEFPLIETINGYNLSLSDHADINSTLEYVSKVNPEIISIDQVRMGNNSKSQNLLDYISNELRIKNHHLQIINNERF